MKNPSRTTGAQGTGRETYCRRYFEMLVTNKKARFIVEICCEHGIDDPFVQRFLKRIYPLCIDEMTLEELKEIYNDVKFEWVVKYVAPFSMHYLTTNNKEFGPDVIHKKTDSEVINAVDEIINRYNTSYILSLRTFLKLLDETFEDNFEEVDESEKNKIDLSNDDFEVWVEPYAEYYYENDFDEDTAEFIILAIPSKWWRISVGMAEVLSELCDYRIIRNKETNDFYIAIPDVDPLDVKIPGVRVFDGIVTVLKEEDRIKNGFKLVSYMDKGMIGRNLDASDHPYSVV